MIELPASHPLSSARGQWGQLWQIGWRWLLAGILAAVFKLPIFGFALALLLFHLWFRGLRHTEYWTPYQEHLTGRHVWVSRIGLVVVGAFSLAGSLSDPLMVNYVAAFAGFLCANLIETFAVPRAFAAKKVVS